MIILTASVRGGKTEYTFMDSARTLIGRIYHADNVHDHMAALGQYHDDVRGMGVDLQLSQQTNDFLCGLPLFD